MIPALPAYDTSGGDAAALVDAASDELFGRAAVEPWHGAVLRALLAGTGAEWSHDCVLYLPLLATSPLVIDVRRKFGSEVSTKGGGSVAERAALQLSAAEQASEVLAALSLNKSLLATVMGVSRPTVYDWFDGKEPNPGNAQRLACIVRLLARAGVSGSEPLNARFVRHPVRDGAPSVLELFSAEQLDEAQILHQLGEARDLGRATEEKRSHREARLRALGFDEPSVEQRKEQLAENVAQLPWPKR